MILFVIFIVGLNTKMAVARKQNLTFVKDPLTPGFDGIGCAIENYNNRVSRGVKVDSRTGKCSNLPESWFANQTHEDNFTYYKIAISEPSFRSRRRVDTVFPYQWHIMAGSSIVVYAELKAGIGYAEEFVINIMTGEDICYHLRARIFYGEIFVNSRRPNSAWGEWNSERHSFTYETMLKFEIRVSADSYNLYLDDADVPFNVYEHRVEMAECDFLAVSCSANNLKIEKLQYFYPV